MPRASTSPKKARAAGPSALRSQSSSPRKSVRRTAVVEVVDEADDSDELSDDVDESEDSEDDVDESLWRSSKIPAERTVRNPLKKTSFTIARQIPNLLCRS